MKFKYIGDLENMGKKVSVYGYDFSGGNVVDVPEDSSGYEQIEKSIYFEAIEPEEAEPEEAEPEAKCGIFKKKNNGQPYSAPEKVFLGCNAENHAKKWLKDNDKDSDKYILMVK